MLLKINNKNERAALGRWQNLHTISCVKEIQRPYGCAPLQGGKFWESPVEPAGLESVSKTSLSTIVSRDPKGNAQIYENNNFPQQLIFP